LNIIAGGLTVNTWSVGRVDLDFGVLDLTDSGQSLFDGSRDFGGRRSHETPGMPHERDRLLHRQARRRQ